LPLRGKGETLQFKEGRGVVEVDEAFVRFTRRSTFRVLGKGGGGSASSI